MTPMIVEHPLLQHKISLLRNKQTGTKEFRDLVGEIATLLCYEATRDLPLEEVEIETPITMAKTKVLAGRKLALVPILRAGMGMLDGMLTLLPAAKVGDKVTKSTTACYFCPIVKLNQDDETEDDTAALTIYLKRDTNVETERDTLARKTDISADRFYAVALSDTSKVVLAKFKK